MIILINEEQLNFLFPKEDVDFVKAWKEKNGEYPKFRQLQQSGKIKNDQFIPTKVGDIVPNHPKKDITTKTYVDRYLKKTLSYIVAKLKMESGELFTGRKRGEKSYVSQQGKALLRSELEVLTYNTFILEGIEDEIEIDSKKFKKTCGGKEPDFVWENKKIIIEVAGMEGEEYQNKLSNAKPCFESLGYTVHIINARNYEKQGKYVNYYIDLCNLLGFIPKQKVIEEPYKFLGYSELNKQQKQKYIDDNINSLPLSSSQTYKLNKYINQLYGYGIKEYKEKNQMKRFRTSIGKDEIKKYKLDNPKMSNQEIANYFGISKNTVQNATVGMSGLKN